MQIVENVGTTTNRSVAIEIKGGTDRSNAHNRAGEAEKSHQKAKRLGFLSCWTIIALHGLDRAVLSKESPTTTEWFDATEVLAQAGTDWERFRDKLVQAVGVPFEIIRSPRQ